MKNRQAKKIIKQQAIRCRSRIDGPEDILTGGCVDYPKGTYLKALITWQRKMNREAAKISGRLVNGFAETSRARLALLIARMAA